MFSQDLLILKTGPGSPGEKVIKPRKWTTGPGGPGGPGGKAIKPYKVKK